MSTLLSSTVSGSTVKGGPPPPTTYSESIVVMDADTGQILYEKNGDIQCMPASTTKVMTALLVIENLDLNKMIIVGKNPPFTEGASMGFKEGEVVMAKELLYALLLHSANDAAEIFAEEISGSTEEFAKLMNEKAKELGATNTSFINPSGLTGEESNLTTARDLALITAAAAQKPELLEISQTLSHMLPLTNLVTDVNRWATNKNKLMSQSSEFYYEPIILGKTGWTPDAGYSFTAIGEKDDQRIVVTMLKSVNQKVYWTETKELMEWAFNNFSVYKLYSEGQTLKKIITKNGDEVNLVADKDFYYAGEKSETTPVAYLEFSEALNLTGNVKAFEVIDTATVLVDGIEAGSINLVAEKDVILAAEKNVETMTETDKTESGTTVRNAASYVAGILFLIAGLMLIVRFVNKSRRQRMKRRKMSPKRMEYYKKREK